MPEEQPAAAADEHKILITHKKVITPDKTAPAIVKKTPEPEAATGEPTQETEMVNELCNVYQYPSDLMGGDKKYNNFAEARKAVITDCVIPLVEARKGVYNKFIKDVLGESVIIEYDYTIFPEMQDDLEKMARIAEQSTSLTYDERRAIQGYEP